MNAIFDSILAANSDTGNLLGIQYGIVAATDDPLTLGRVQVYDQAKGGKHKSDWLIRGLPFTSFSPPIPAVGDLVVFGYILGDPHHGCYLGMAVNQVNKPVGAPEDFTIVLGKTTVKITLQGIVSVDGAKEVKVTSTDKITVKSPLVTIDSPSVVFSNTTSATIGGKQIATVTAPVSGGGTVIDKGW